MSDNQTVHDQTVHNQGRQEKKAQFSAPQQKRRKSTAIIIIVLVALAGVAAYLISTNLKSGPATAKVATGESGDIRVPLSDLNDGVAKFFSYTSHDSNKTVRFFVIKSSDGVYRAALDACDNCFHAKRGYKQQGDDMVCMNCGLHFNSTLINEVSRGCNPVGVPREIEGDHVVIKAKELESRTSYF